MTAPTKRDVSAERLLKRLRDYADSECHQDAHPAAVRLIVEAASALDATRAGSDAMRKALKRLRGWCVAMSDALGPDARGVLQSIDEIDAALNQRPPQ